MYKSQEEKEAHIDQLIRNGELSDDIINSLWHELDGLDVFHILEHFDKRALMDHFANNVEPEMAFVSMFRADESIRMYYKTELEPLVEEWIDADL